MVDGYDDRVWLTAVTKYVLVLVVYKTRFSTACVYSAGPISSICQITTIKLPLNTYSPESES